MSTQQRIDELTEPNATDFVAGQEPVEDAGTKARARLAAKAAARKVKWMIKWSFIVVCFVLVFSGIGKVAWGYYTQETGFTENHRTCSAMIGGVKITGTRTYNYPYRDFMGARIILKEKVIETTRIDLTGDPMTIVPVVLDGKDYGKSYALSERGSPIVKTAPMYVIVSGKSNGIIEYEAFCKTQPRPVTEAGE